VPGYLHRSYKNDVAERSFAAVVALYRLAAAQGHYAAQFLLGSMYRSDDGVAQDFAAVLRHKLAAAQGLGAALRIGKFYVQGWVLLLGVLLPIRRIARLCKRAAVAGAL